jgi:hypothetical protein
MLRRFSSGLAWATATGLLVALSMPVRAFADEMSAADIARKARDQGSLNLVGLKAEMKLTNIEKDGTKQERDVVTQSKKIDGTSHGITRFKSPADVAGVALLVISGKDGAKDDISLYLPKIRRARKIAQANRGDAFMESEFSYADFSGDSVDEKASNREKDGTVGDKAVYVLSGAPPDSPYKKVVASIDKTSFIPLRVEYYDDKGLLKVYTVQKVEQKAGRTMATESTMENQRTGRKTTISIGDVSTADAPDTAFTERALERG